MSGDKVSGGKMSGGKVSYIRYLNANKAMGPDKINGRVLKNCSISLSTPLSILFEKCYNSSLIADE